MPPKQQTLPDKDSELLRLAVSDCQKAEASDEYELDMSTWAEKYKGQPCAVCMAGSVMVGTLGVGLLGTPHGESVYPELFSYEVCLKLRRIDHMRRGSFSDCTLHTLAGQVILRPNIHPEQDQAGRKARRVICGSYNSSTDRAPWSAYLKAADILEAAGL